MSTLFLVFCLFLNGLAARVGPPKRHLPDRLRENQIKHFPSKLHEKHPEIVDVKSLIESGQMKKCGMDDLHLAPLKIEKLVGIEAEDCYSFPVVWTVVQSTNGDGSVSDSDIQKQIEVLNAAFSTSMPFQFTTMEINRVTNDIWAAACYDKWDEIQSSTSVDPTNNINVILCDAQGILGVAYLPGMAEDDYRNGAIVDYRTLPGGSYSGYDLGHTATHEIGHYLGLQHTFDSGCSPGDGVEDTPPENEPMYDCTEERDTCPGDGLNDPYWNYMDYSYDYCFTHFTAGQGAYSKSILLQYKPKLMSNSICTSPPGTEAPAPNPTTVAPEPPATEAPEPPATEAPEPATEAPEPETEAPEPETEAPTPSEMTEDPGECAQDECSILCQDYCPYANDGVCDDGGEGAVYVDCFIGTDCSDCGERQLNDVTFCNNKCPWRNDGECDDGGPDALGSWCLYGSDCNDCGPRGLPCLTC